MGFKVKWGRGKNSACARRHNICDASSGKLEQFLHDVRISKGEKFNLSRHYIWRFLASFTKLAITSTSLWKYIKYVYLC